LTIHTFDTRNGIYAFSESGVTTDYHAHPALECIIAKEGCFTLSTSGRRLENIRLGLVLPNQIHAFQGEHCTVDFIFIESGCIDLQGFLTAIGTTDDGSGIIAPDERFSDLVSREGLQAWHDTEYGARMNDKRIQACIHHIRDNIAAPRMPLATLANVAHLSPGRLSHLFREQTGLPVSKFILWERMKAAIDLVVRQDADLTQAAHAAGFYDSAHFSRCFKEWFGIKPSAVYNNSKIVQAGV
jgi:AraC-like DNA-binding protein